MTDVYCLESARAARQVNAKSLLYPWRQTDADRHHHLKLTACRGLKVGDHVRTASGIEGKISWFRGATTTMPDIAFVVMAGITHSVPVRDCERIIPIS